MFIAKNAALGEYTACLFDRVTVVVVILLLKDVVMYSATNSSSELEIGITACEG